MNQVDQTYFYWTNLTTVELNYYWFMISLDKCNESCNAVDDLPAKIYFPKKTKYVNP